MPESEVDLVNETLREGPGDRSDAGFPARAPARERVAVSDGPAQDSTEGVRRPADPAHAVPLPGLRALKAPRAISARRARRGLILATAFAAGVAGIVILFVVTAMAISAAHADRVLPGVRVGAVDISGLTRQEAIYRLRNSYSYLAQGDVQITTPAGTSTVAYGLIGRAPDAEAMVDAALRAGRTGNPLGDAVTIWRSAVGGRSVPIAIRIDPEAVAAHVRQLTLTSRLAPRDAEATLFYGTFVYWPSATGSAVDEEAIGEAIIRNLTQPDAPTHFQVGGAFVALRPQVGDDDAGAAIEAAERMAVDVTLTMGSTASPRPSQSSAPARTFFIPAATIRSWIDFGSDAQGVYGPGLDLARVEAFIKALPKTMTIAPVEPRVVFNSSGMPTSLEGGRDGVGIDASASARAIESYLLSLAGGGNREPSLALVTGPIPPRLNVASLTGLTILGGGDAAWTTVFYPGETNGNGLNIRTPAVTLNGQIVAPGEQFSFLKAVGPIDAAHGYTMGGVILHGKSHHTGAMGGGICSVSTTMFNAALRAGLQIDERHAHAYYINRYPEGLDATVFLGSEDLKWTNDTPNPIVIRAWATNKAKSTITIQLWSLPLDRSVILDYPPKRLNVVKAGDSTVYVSTLPPGEKYRAEYPTDGYDIVRTRTVFEEDGTLIHSDTWKSHYTKVDGLLQIGASAPPTPTPTAIFVLPALALLRAAVTVTRRDRRA